MIRSVDQRFQPHHQPTPPCFVPSSSKHAGKKSLHRAPLRSHPPAPARWPPRPAWTHVRTGNAALADRPAPPPSPSPTNLFCCARLIVIESLGLWSELSSPVALRSPPLPPRCAGGVPADQARATGGDSTERSSASTLGFPSYWPSSSRAAIAGDARVVVFRCDSRFFNPDELRSDRRLPEGFSVGNRGSAAMDGEAKQGASCSIKKTLRCSVRLSWRYASEHRALFSIALLLYLLYRSSPRFFAFVLSSSPVIICTAILLGTLLSSGIKDLPEMDEGEKAPCDNSTPKFGSHSRNGHIEAYKRFSVPAVKENIIREASFGRRDSNKQSDLDESVPLLTGGCQRDDRADAAGGRLGKLYTSVLSTETMQQEVGMVHKDAFSGKDKEDQYDGKDTSIREVDGLMTETNHQGRMFTESQSGEVGGVSEHKAADGDEVGKRRWGRAFSVRRRKKLAGIKIEAINPAVDNQSDYSLLSPFTRTGSHDYDCSAGFDSDNAERYSLDVSVTNTAPVPDATETDPLLGADFPCSGPAKNDNSENHAIICSLDSGTGSNSNDVPDNSKAKEDGEEKRKDAGNEPGFIWTADDEKNDMDLGYSEIERNRRLETLMSRRKSRKHMTFELEAISARRPNPFGDNAEVPGSAPSILHPRKNPFDFLSEQSNDGDVVPAPHNLNPWEPTPAPHQDTFFKRYESFSFGRPQQQRHVPRFKPLEESSFDEASASNFQRQFSDRSVSRLSVASECDTVSSVGGDPEHNELIRNYIRGVRESPGLLRQDSERSDGISFGENDTLLSSAE